MKKNNEKQLPVLQTERFLLVKVDAKEHEIKDLLLEHGVNFEDLVIQSIPDS
ncbi:MAG TPA: hypothetical protein VKM55_24180 [Candidatus Lokiarchaeia archaeon]|nr:hypothetical protein [Candidatus Lokiarchaeia archaeon]